MNPSQAFANRTARLHAEGAHLPRVAYTSTREGEVARKSAVREQVERQLVARAEKLACGEDFCHICGRCTDHFNDHGFEQILAWARTPSLVQSLLNERFDV